MASMGPALWADAVGWEAVPLALALVAAAFVLVASVWPYLGLRLAMAILTRSVMWLRVRGRSCVPRTGPVLLVCSPLSYLGWLLILTACPRRVRFLILAGWTDQGVPGWLLRRAGAITPTG